MTCLSKHLCLIWSLFYLLFVVFNPILFIIVCLILCISGLMDYNLNACINNRSALVKIKFIPILVSLSGLCIHATFPKYINGPVFYGLLYMAYILPFFSYKSIREHFLNKAAVSLILGLLPLAAFFILSKSIVLYIGIGGLIINYLSYVLLFVVVSSYKYLYTFLFGFANAIVLSVLFLNCNSRISVDLIFFMFINALMSINILISNLWIFYRITSHKQV